MVLQFRNMGYALSKILILFIIILTFGGIFGWRYWKTSEENISKEVVTNYTEEKLSGEKIIEPEAESPKEGIAQGEKSAKKEIITPTCQDECSQTGIKRCSDNGYQICGNYDADTCLEWGSTISCPKGMGCRGENCVIINTPKPGVEYWAVSLTTHENNFESLLLKDILVNNGWKENHIKYFLAKDATRENLLSSLDWLRNNSDANDIILFYDSSHGSSGSIWTLSSQLMTYADLAKEFESIKYGGLAFVINACYSGSAISYLKGNNRVILTSSRGDELGDWEFQTQFFHALQGFGDIKGNNNDWVSIEETFNFMKPSYSSSLPQIKDDYPGDLDITFLNGNFFYLDQYNATTDFVLFANYVVGAVIPEYNNTLIAQSFKPIYPTLTKVMLELTKPANINPGPLIVSIRKDLSGPDLTSTIIDQNTFFSGEVPNLYTFDFPDIKVVPNETYYIVIEALEAVHGGGTYNGYNFRGFKNDYSRGEVYNVRYPEYLWPSGEQDLFFATFGKPN